MRLTEETLCRGRAAREEELDSLSARLDTVRAEGRLCRPGPDSQLSERRNPERASERPPHDATEPRHPRLGGLRLAR